MTDTSVAAPAPTGVTPDEQVDALYTELEDDAAIAYVTYFLAHTPAELQELMKTKVSANLPQVSPPGDEVVKAMVAPAPAPAAPPA